MTEFGEVPQDKGFFDSGNSAGIDFLRECHEIYNCHLGM